MKIAILGNGAWGTALDALAQRRGHTTRVWGPPFSGHPSQDLEEALIGAEVALLAIPSHVMREVCQSASPFLPRGVLLVSVAKGIEQDTDLCMSQVIFDETRREEIAALSGPSFAAEVKQGLPTAVVCASRQEPLAETVQGALNGEDFRVYTSRDIRGVELGGALKNVIAVAAGACAGLGLGENALAALITRALAELARVGTALGGEAQTFFGLSGAGDLMLTCSSTQSRNFQVGKGLGEGRTLDEILKNLAGTAEGVKTARSVHQILETNRLDAPILLEVYRILYEGKPARAAVKALMAREPKKEAVLPSAPGERRPRRDQPL